MPGRWRARWWRSAPTRGVRTEALISRMDAPLGRAVGNALEIRECVTTLKGQGPPALTELIVRLATRMLRLAGGVADDAAAEARVRDVLASGAALQRFARMIARQGGDARIVDRDDLLPWAARRTVVEAPRSGVVQHVDAEQIGRASMLLGAGRDRVDAPIDHAAGIVLAVEPGSRVETGAPLMELHDNHAGQYDEARALAGAAVTLGDGAPPVVPLILDWIHL